MKKLVYLFVSIAIVFTSCNPLEDIDAALEESTKLDGIVGDVSYKLTSEDYTEDLDDGGFGFSNEYFVSLSDVETLMPAFISKKYPALGATFVDGKVDQKSLAIITYNLQNLVNVETYTVTDADYTAIGLTSLNSKSEFNTILASKFAGVSAGTIVELTYKTLAPQIEYTLTNDDYALVGNGSFNNFDIRPGRSEETLEARRVKIDQILKANYPATPVGQQYLVTYAIFDGSSGERQMLVQLEASGDYKLINSYTLTNADFALVGNGNFNNFDIRAGRAEETIESRRAKIETILLNNFPATASGDQYFVTYAVWNNQNETRTMLLEFNGTGYDIVAATLITKTSRFAFNNDWDFPQTFTAADYTAMGQSFPNFSNRETAEYNIAIYLKTLYPYATPDTFLPVELEIFREGIVNINFHFDGTNWNAIQEVIETTAQFSHDGNTWEFDNTIKYTLTQADYDLVGNGNFANFDVRTGRDEETVEARLAKINTILLNNFPQYGAGQKFSVSYNVWKPGDDVFVMNVIHNGTEYELQ